MAVVGWAVVCFGDPNVGHVVEDLFKVNPGLDSGQWAARTAVCTPPERDMLTDVGASKPKLCRAFEMAGIAIGGPGQKHHGGAWWKFHAANRYSDPS